MADKITKLYDLAKERGVLTDGLTEDMFRKQTDTEEKLKGFYDIASPKIKLGSWDTFKANFQNASAPQQEAKPEAQSQKRHGLIGGFAAAAAPQTLTETDVDYSKSAEGMQDAAIKRQNAAKLPGEKKERNDVSIGESYQKPYDLITGNIPDDVTLNAEGLTIQTAQAEKERADIANQYAQNKEYPHSPYKPVDPAEDLDKKYPTGKYTNQEEIYQAVWSSAKQNDPELAKRFADADAELQALIDETKTNLKKTEDELAGLVRSGKMSAEEAQDRYNTIHDEEVAKVGAFQERSFTKIYNSANEKYQDYIIGQTRKLAQRELASELPAIKEEALKAARVSDVLTDRYAVSAAEIADRAMKLNNAGINRDKEGFGAGFKAGITDPYTWTSGVLEAIHGVQGKKVLDKYYAGEKLTEGENALLKSLTYYMAAEAYNSPLLKRMYKAGMTSAQSIPFMLEFVAANPAMLQDAVIKKLVGYGMEEFGKQGGKVLAKELGAHALGTMAGAGAMTATFGAPRIVAGTAQRMNGSVETPFAEGSSAFTLGKREGQQSFGEAAWNATVDTFVENLSEMILTNNPLTKRIGEAMKPITSTMADNPIGQIVAKIWDTPQWKEFATRAQYGGSIEEFNEELIGNVMRWGFSSDTHDKNKTWRENAGLDADTLTDTALGVIPMTMAMTGGNLLFGASIAIADVVSDKKLVKKAGVGAILDEISKAKASNDMIIPMASLHKSLQENKELTQEEKNKIFDSAENELIKKIREEADEQKRKDEAEANLTPEEKEAKAAVDNINEQTNDDDELMYNVSVSGKDGEWRIKGGTPIHVENGQLVSDEDLTGKPEFYKPTIVVISTDANGKKVEFQTTIDKLTLLDQPISAEQAAAGVATNLAADKVMEAENAEHVWYEKDGQAFELTKDGEEYTFVATGDKVDASMLADMGYKETTDPNAPVETPEAAEPERTPVQIATDDFVAKHGENAVTKLDTTIKAVEKDKKDAEKKLADAKKKLADLPDAYNDATRKAEEKAQQEVANAQAKVDEYSGILERYNGIKAEMDARAAAEVPAVETPAEEAASTDPTIARLQEFTRKGVENLTDEEFAEMKELVDALPDWYALADGVNTGDEVAMEEARKADAEFTELRKMVEAEAKRREKPVEPAAPVEKGKPTQEEKTDAAMASFPVVGVKGFEFDQFKNWMDQLEDYVSSLPAYSGKVLVMKVFSGEYLAVGKSAEALAGISGVEDYSRQNTRPLVAIRSDKAVKAVKKSGVDVVVVDKAVEGIKFDDEKFYATEVGKVYSEMMDNVPHINEELDKYEAILNEYKSSHDASDPYIVKVDEALAEVNDNRLLNKADVLERQASEELNSVAETISTLNGLGKKELTIDDCKSATQHLVKSSGLYLDAAKLIKEAGRGDGSSEMVANNNRLIKLAEAKIAQLEKESMSIAEYAAQKAAESKKNDRIDVFIAEGRKFSFTYGDGNKRKVYIAESGHSYEVITKSDFDYAKKHGGNMVSDAEAKDRETYAELLRLEDWWEKDYAPIGSGRDLANTIKEIEATGTRFGKMDLPRLNRLLELRGLRRELEKRIMSYDELSEDNSAQAKTAKEEGEKQEEQQQEQTEHQEQKSESKEKKSASWGSKNKVFSQDAYEEARARMRARLNRLNAGIDPQALLDGMIVAGYHVEAGARKFVEYAKKMLEDFGEGIRPYLKAYYNGMRDLPEAAELAKEMDDFATVSGIDINTITLEKPKRQSKYNVGDVVYYGGINGMLRAKIAEVNSDGTYAISNDKNATKMSINMMNIDEKDLYDIKDTDRMYEFFKNQFVGFIEKQNFTQSTLKQLESQIESEIDKLKKKVEQNNGGTEIDMVEGIRLNGMLSAVLDALDNTPTDPKGGKKAKKKQKDLQKPLQNQENSVPLQENPAIGNVTKDVDTRDNTELWVVKPEERTDKETFDGLKKRAKAFNGAWSGFKKGFIFRSEEEANNFNNKSVEAPAVTEAPKQQLTIREAAAAKMQEKVVAESEGRFKTEVKDLLLNALRTNEKPLNSIVAIRSLAAKNGIEVKEDGKSDIYLQELVEDGIVQAARTRMAEMRKEGASTRMMYDEIVNLYNLQPTIARRSNTRLAMQQYSTPLPMSFVADMFAYRDNMERGFEPTAGNGMLMIGVPSEKMDANELDDTRLANLRKGGFANVTKGDATIPFERGKVYDFIVSNPPFGAAEGEQRGIFKISGLEQVIAVNALDQLKDEGRAAIIVGGNMEYASNGSISSAKQKNFYGYLYDNYNVVGVVDMAGDLYAKQGTQYPTRMILINGRRSAEDIAKSRIYPPVENAAIGSAKTFEELYNIVEKLNNDNQKTNGYEVLRSESTKINGTDNSQAQREPDGIRPQEQPRQRDGQSGVVRSGAGEKPASEGANRMAVPKREGQTPSTGGASSVPSGRSAGGSIERTGGNNTVAGGREHNNGNTSGVGQQSRMGQNGNAVTPKKEEMRELTSDKLSYRPHNSAFSLQSVAPAAMVEAMDNFLKKVESEYGDIDTFVTDELGYDNIDSMHKALASEQVDSVAMAIYQMKNGQALIIGDQTGVGKGRQMASLIRWANKQGKKPVFFTQKKELLSDIYRDLVDIGSGDLRPFIFNTNEKITDQDGNVVYRALTANEQQDIMKGNELPDDYDFAVLTYSQIQTGDEESRASDKNNKESKTAKKPRPDYKASFLRRLANDNYLFLDESHTAAGAGKGGAFMRSIIGSTAGVTYASATFAKRADTMPLYALRTIMSKANIESDKLIEVIERGGVTLQEIMSRYLTKAGQMVRRERDMSDVITDWETIDNPEIVKKSREQYDKTIAAFNAIIKFQKLSVDSYLQNMRGERAMMMENVKKKKGTDKMGIDNQPFASKTYNYTKQLMLALKADAVVERVVKEIERGLHPVIALENTMESAFKDYSVGEVVDDPTFASMLLRGLDKALEYTVEDSEGNASHSRITLSELGIEGEAAYYELRDFIIESTKDIFVSPIDAIKAGLASRGYSCGELTGRQTEIVKNADGDYVVRTRADKDKKKLMRDFNSGKIDVLILNKSASTGISLHASERFQDQRQRAMIIAQPLSDINDYMQMIGRIDRTGQVARGYYVNLGLPIPAENRFLMMLSTKLKSLNANTTTSQDNDGSDVEAPDLLNKYGDEVVVEYLKDNPSIYGKLEDPFKLGLDDKLEEYSPSEDDALKVTGRVALLSTEEQEAFYSDVVKRYVDLINYKNEIGENDLKITVMPLRAKTLERKISSQGVSPDGDNPFAQNAYLETVEVDVLKKPFKAKEVEKAMEGIRYGKNGYTELQEKIVSEAEAKRQSEEKRFEEATKKADNDIESMKQRINARIKMTEEDKAAEIDKREADIRKKLNDVHERSLEKIGSIEQEILRGVRSFVPGKSYLMPSDLNTDNFKSSSPAIFIGYKAKEEGITPSTTFAVFAVLDGRKRIEIKFSDMDAINRVANYTDMNYDAAQQVTLDNWDSQIPTGTRKKAFIMTGNIIQAINDTMDEYGNFVGQLISYTDEQGGIHEGVLMPDAWTSNDLRSGGVPINARMQSIINGVDLTSTDGAIRIAQMRRSVYKLFVPKSKLAGGKYFEDSIIKGAVDGGYFSQRGDKFVADIYGDEDLRTIVNRLSQMGVRVPSDESKEERSLYSRGDSQGVDKYENGLTEAQQAATDAVITMLDVAGVKVKISENEETDVYGYVKNGEVTLSKRGINPNTQVHEYSHLWCAAVRKNNPELWKNVRELFAPYLDAVRSDEAYQGLSEDDIVDEAVVRFSGKQGAERAVAEAQRLIDENPSIKGRARARMIIGRIKQALDKLWSWIGKNLFKIERFNSPEEVADRIMYDLANKTNLRTGEVGGAKSVEEIRELDNAHARAERMKDEYEGERLVKEAAAEAMFGNKLVGWDGLPIEYIHTTTEDFTKFDNAKISGNRGSVLGKRFYFSPDARSYSEYGDKQMRVFIDVKNPYNASDPLSHEWIENNDALLKEVIFDGYKEHPYIMEKLRSPRGLVDIEGYLGREIVEGLGFDGIVYGGGWRDDAQVAVINPNQIKSAEPFTYDDNGNLIPLSQRFNEENPDIRYQRTAPTWKDKLDDLTAPEALTIPEAILSNTIAAAVDHAENTRLVTEAVKQIDARLADLRKAMYQQKVSDSDALDKLTSMAKIFLKNGWVGSEDKAELREVISTIGKAANGTMEDNIQRMMMAVTKSHLSHTREAFNTLRHTKSQKLNISGVVEQGAVDVETQYRLATFNEGIKVKAEKLDEYIHEALDKYDRETDDTKKAQYASAAYGYMVAQKYLETVGELREEAVELEKVLREVKEKSFKGAEHPILAKREALREAKEAIITNRLEQVKAYDRMNQELFATIYIGKAKAAAFRKAQVENMNKIRHFANSDTQGVSTSQFYKSTALQNATNSFLAAGGLFSPLQSLNSMLKVLAPKAPNGQGYLYDHFIRGYVDSSEAEYRGLKEVLNELDVKATEILGKKADWADMAENLNKGNTMEVSILEDDDATNVELAQGQLGYLYAINKMADGRMKLRAMGIAEADMARIEAALDPKVKELMDWLQSDFLPRTRNKYNKVYEQMFGAPMAAIDNYFPLRINKKSLNQSTDLANDMEGVGNLSGTTTGATKERRRNSKPIDIMNADAFNVMIEHLTEMEHWAAFAQLNRDANILMSYTGFKNKLGHMTTMYGSGKQLEKNLKDCFKLSLGTYDVKKDKASAFELNIAKGISTSKITLRIWTAAKQILSHPAFYTEIAEGDGTFVPEYLKNLATPYHTYKWAMDNLPLFEKRVRSRQVGDTRLMDNEEDWKIWHSKVVEWCTRIGMSPNAFVDALTCAQGAKAVYESHKRMYINRGMSEADAERRAKQDASICYNETQQSSEGAFVSTVQRDQNAQSIFVSLFNNANMAYMRRLNEHAGELYESTFGKGKDEQIEYLTKKYIRMGLDEDNAAKYAKTDYNRSIGRSIFGIATFGYLMQAIWRLGGYIPYLLFGDDDDEKEKLVKKAFTGGALATPVRGTILGKGLEAALDGYGWKNVLANTLPIEEDIKNYEQLYKSGKEAEFVTDMLNMLTSMFIGINPETLTNMGIVIVDAFDGNLEYSKDFTTLIFTLMSVPESQIKKMYVDELGASGEEILRTVRYNPNAMPELAKRYAERNMKRTAPFFPRTEEEKQQAIKSSFNSIKREATERIK